MTVYVGCVQGRWASFVPILFKIDMPNSITYLNRTFTFVWYAVRCGFKNGYHRNMCLKKYGLHAQNMVTILGSLVNKRERERENQL